MALTSLELMNASLLPATLKAFWTKVASRGSLEQFLKMVNPMLDFFWFSWNSCDNETTMVQVAFLSRQLEMEKGNCGFLW